MIINQILQRIINDVFRAGYTHYFYVISIFFILLPIALITGPFLPDFFLTMIAIYFLVITFKKKTYQYYKNYFVYFFSLFYLLILISGILSPDPFQSLIAMNGPIFYLRYLFFVLGCWYLIDQNSKLISYFLGIMFVVILFVIIDGFVQ